MLKIHSQQSLKRLLPTHLNHGKPILPIIKQNRKISCRVEHNVSEIKDLNSNV